MEGSRLPTFGDPSLVSKGGEAKDWPLAREMKPGEGVCRSKFHERAHKELGASRHKKLQALERHKEQAGHTHVLGPPGLSDLVPGASQSTSNSIAKPGDTLLRQAWPNMERQVVWHKNTQQPT